MMSDDEILSVVQAHKEGKKIQARIKGPLLSPEEGWCPTIQPYEKPAWNFERFDYRVAPEPRKPIEIWLQECGGGIWQQKWDGVGQHFREVIS